MTVPLSFSPLHLTTEHGPPQKRVELVREVFGQQILNVGIEPVPETEFRAELRLRTLPGLKMITSRVHGLTTGRSLSELHDGNDDLFVSISLAGNLVAEQRHQQMTLEGGLVHLASNAEPMSFVHVNSRAMGLVVPRKAMDALLPDIDDRIGMPLPREPLGLQLLQNYVLSLTQPDLEFNPALAHTVVTHVHDLLAMVLGAAGEGREIATARGLKAARLNAIKTYVARHLADPGLSINAVAQAHRLTLRSVQRLFEQEGTTFSAYLLEQRLERVCQSLADPAQRDRTIGAIASAAGFGDLPHFNHMFRRRYHATPGDMRAAARIPG